MEHLSFGPVDPCSGVHFPGKLQTDFGITPISAAGGTINVKDELAMRFTIVAKATGQHPADKPAPDKKR
jgi:hypothetical protein